MTVTGNEGHEEPPEGIDPVEPHNAGDFELTAGDDMNGGWVAVPVTVSIEEVIDRVRQFALESSTRTTTSFGLATLLVVEPGV